MKYHQVTVGGTFDYFHAGHKKLLATAFAAGETVALGITTPEYIREKRAGFSVWRKGFEKRKNEVVDYLKKNGWFERTKIIPLTDKFGTTLTDKNLQAIIVSGETEAVAKEINVLRIERLLPALDILTVPWVLAQDGQPIHTTRIINGEIDRKGSLFTLPPNWGVRKITESLRQQLKIPMGRLITGSSKNHKVAIKIFIKNYRLRQPKADPPLAEITNSTIPYILDPTPYTLTPNPYTLYPIPLLITVGDGVTDAILKEGITPDVSIVDFMIQRKQVYSNIASIGFRNIKVHKIVNNPAGTLSFQAFAVLYNLIKNEAKPSVLQVNGEEDLLGLLAVYCATLGSLIVYGQPAYAAASAGKAQQGIVVIEVNEENKQMVRNYLDKFET